MGDMVQNNNVKFNLLRLKSLILHNKYYKKIHIKDKENNILLLMNKYINNLKEIDLIYTMADIESIKYDNTSYPDTLLNNERVNRFSFYSIVIGYLDGNIEFFNKKLYNEKKFKNNKLDDCLFNFINFREQIISELNANIHNSDSKILIDIINTKPCYKNFSVLSISNMGYSNKNNLEIIIAYTIGYINFDKFYFDEVYYKYLKLVQELNNYKNKNRSSVVKIKAKKNK